MAEPALRRTLAGDAETAAFGAAFSKMLMPGDLVLLEGDLGAGKTALARAIIRARLDDPGLDVPSPTFLLVLPYEAAGHRLLHADLYRLRGESEIDELGLGDDPEAIVLVEWPDRAPVLAGRADWIVRLAIPAGGVGREIIAEAPREPSRVTALKNAGI